MYMYIQTLISITCTCICLYTPISITCTYMCIHTHQLVFDITAFCLEVFAVKASCYFVNGLTSNIFTPTWARLSSDSFLYFTVKLVNIVVAVDLLEAVFNEGIYTWVLKIVTDGQTGSLTNLIKCVVVCRSYSNAFWLMSLWAPGITCTYPLVLHIHTYIPKPLILHVRIHTN